MSVRSTVQGVLRVAATTLMLTVTVAAGTAHADTSAECLADACLFRVDKLTAYPTDGMANINLARRIKLDRGKYSWNTQVWPPRSCTSDIDLVGGEYSWRATLDPKDGYYLVSSVIENVAGGTPERRTCTVDLDPPHHMKPTTWGSDLYGPY
jgi:hypothetical protein